MRASLTIACCNCVPLQVTCRAGRWCAVRDNSVRCTTPMAARARSSLVVPSKSRVFITATSPQPTKSIHSVSAHNLRSTWASRNSNLYRTTGETVNLQVICLHVALFPSHLSPSRRAGSTGSNTALWLGWRFGDPERRPQHLLARPVKVEFALGCLGQRQYDLGAVRHSRGHHGGRCRHRRSGCERAGSWSTWSPVLVPQRDGGVQKIRAFFGGPAGERRRVPVQLGWSP